jgi:hypothetical protein
MADENQKPPFMSNEVYDFLKYVALVLLPAIGTLYFAIASIWHLPAAEEVVGTIVAVDTFLGVALRFAQKSYDGSDSKYDGFIDITTSANGGKSYMLNLNSDPSEIDVKSEVLFKVNSPE